MFVRSRTTPRWFTRDPSTSAYGHVLSVYPGGGCLRVCRRAQRSSGGLRLRQRARLDVPDRASRQLMRPKPPRGRSRVPRTGARMHIRRERSVGRRRPAPRRSVLHGAAS
jgi:hypothetical protein